VLVGLLKDDNTVIVLNDSDKAELLSSYFSSVFTTDNNVIPTIPNSVNSSEILEEVFFSFEKTKRILRRLKPKHTVGPDGLTAFFLKRV